MISLRVLRVFAISIITLSLVVAWYTYRQTDDELSSFVAGLIPLLIGLVEPVLAILDKRPPPKPIESSTKNTIEKYLAGRLRAHAQDEGHFVNLAGIPLSYITDTEKFDDIELALDEFTTGFVLVGEPGAGKSTVLRHLERKLILKYQRNREGRRWPLLINLGLTNNPIDADALLEHVWQSNHLLGSHEPLMSTHAFWLLMDGLNEMPLDTRSKRAKALKAFLQKQEVAIPTIVTCRVEDYEQDRDLFFDLPAVHIQDLDSPRIEEFLDKRKKGELWDELKKESNSNLRELARNPYKLVMLIEVFDSHRKQLPASLNELYEGRNRLRQNVIQLRRAVIQLRTGLPKA